ncbi:MAG: T9SS type A sorting domain-containing protein [Flavobacteriales bacterium]|nr:T9SS type A sorting domain-containing protein [Flavobacteriales bacterium]
MTKVFYFLTALLLITSLQGIAQIQHGGVPLSFSFSNAKTTQNQIVKSKMPSIDLQRLQNEDLVNDQFKDQPWRFGENHSVSIDVITDGTVDLVPGGKVFRYRIDCPQATSINLLFDAFDLVPGGEMFLYNEDHTIVLGAFTEQNNKANGELGTAILEGDHMIIEYFEPSQYQGQSSLHIGRVTHGYRGIGDFKKGFGDSGPCNNNVECPVANGWEDQINSVAIIVVNGSGFCTGALINNTCTDETPYFLTANHCLSGSVSNWVFLFNYQSPTCTPNQNGPSTDWVSGATLRANNPGSDVALLEISSSIPSSYGVYYAGWDRSGIAPTSAVAIHHPSGDIKKISFENDPLTATSWGGASVWEVADWDDGTTEPGSSGSPLFDQNKRIVGQLYGGSAACGNNLDDNYGRFDVSWNNSANPSAHLETWLDGCNTNAVILDGLDPNAPSNLVCDFSQSADTIIMGGTVDFTDLTANNPTNWLWTFQGGIPSSSNAQNPSGISWPVQGTYTVTMQAWSGTDTCTHTSTVEVEFSCNGGPDITGATTTDVTCNGDCDGQIDLSVNSNMPVVYSWSNGATTEDLNNLCPGTYTVTVSDSLTFNCWDTASFSINEPAVLVLNTSSTDETAPGAGDGTANANVTGGISPYDYLWSTGATSSSVSNLSPGTYFLAVQDANGCALNDTVIISTDTTQTPCNVSISGANLTEPKCNGDCNGSIDLNINTTVAVTYLWSNGATTEDISGLCAGTYTVTVSDSLNSSCFDSASFVIVEPTALVLNISSTDETSAGASDGTANANVSGGITPYSYSWSNGGTTANIANLSAGAYFLTVQDANGCSIMDSVIISIDSNQVPCAGIIDSISSQNVKCPGECDGQIDLTAANAISYLWSNGATTEDIINLCVGSYTVTVQDSAGCIDTATAIIGALSTPINLTLSSTDESSAGAADGTATVAATGGSAPLSFNWNTGASTQTITGLTSAYYSVLVVDLFGCSAYDSVFVGVQGAGCPYVIQDASPSCPGDTFCVWLDATQNVNNGIIGMDYCLNYDSTVMTPTGGAEIGSVVYNTIGQGNGEEVLLNTNIPGQVYSAIYYNANTPQNTFWQGQGNVLCIEFVLDANATPGTYSLTTCELEEAYSLVEIPRCADPGVVDINTQTIGRIVYWDYDSIMNGPVRPLQYDAANPSTYLRTDIMAANDSSIVANPDLNGQFAWNPIVDDSIRIVRDIQGTYGDTGTLCSDVFLFINGADAYTAALISNYDMNNLLDTVNPWYPNPFQMIAGDVNMSDKVRANDVTLIQSRSVRSICEYPQNWNYTGGTPANPLPGPGAPPSKDWRFLEMEMVYDSTHNLYHEYQIDANYPVYSNGNSTGGYWRDNVPTVPELLNASNSDSTVCAQGANKTYYGVLLGDLTGSWDPNNLSVANVRATGEMIILDVYPTSNGYSVEVSYNGNDLAKSLDLRFDYDQSFVSIINTGVAQNNQSASAWDWNDFENDKLYLTSFSESGFNNSKHLFSIELATSHKMEVQDFANVLGLINGDIAQVSVTVHGTNGVNDLLITEGYVNVYPNPSSDLINFEYAIGNSEYVQLTMMNSLGEVIFDQKRSNNGSLQMLTLDVTDLSKGIYYLKVSSKEFKKVERIIIQ